MTDDDRRRLQMEELEIVVGIISAMLGAVKGEIFHYEVIIFGAYVKINLHHVLEMCKHLTKVKVRVIGNRISIWNPGFSEVQTCFENRPCVGSTFDLIHMRELKIFERSYLF